MHTGQPQFVRTLPRLSLKDWVNSASQPQPVHVEYCYCGTKCSGQNKTTDEIEAAYIQFVQDGYPGGWGDLPSKPFRDPEYLPTYTKAGDGKCLELSGDDPLYEYNEGKDGQDKCDARDDCGGYTARVKAATFCGSRPPSRPAAKIGTTWRRV